MMEPNTSERFQNTLISTGDISHHIALSDIFQSNIEILEGIKEDLDSNCIFTLIDDNSNTKNWKSNLCKIEPLTLFQKSLSCHYCEESDSKPSGINQFQETSCMCTLPIETCQGNENENRCRNTLSDNYGSVTKSSAEPICFKPKLVRTKPNSLVSGKNLTPSQSTTYKNKPDTLSKEDILTEDEENKSHKSNVAKITFKTAKEQLLASNPAARRTLGASRKAQAKFISPMLGAQENKVENQESEITDERLKHIDPKMIELIESEIIDKGCPIEWDDIAGLQMAKSVIQEAVVWPLLRPDIFTGLRRPPKGILLFGPPGTGKTLIGKCIASQCRATFFSISASSLTSKWIGDGEKMVRALFAVARCHQPAVIFIDEIDSLLTQRSDSEHEATRRIKTEFLVQFDGAATGDEDRLLIVGATNRPQELDEAARRRLVKRLYIPLPDSEARTQIISNLLKSESNNLTLNDISELGEMTEGYSGADMKSVCCEAAMGPVRAVPLSQITSIDRSMVRPVCLQDFKNALQRVRPSVSQDDLGVYVKWNQTYGQGF